MDKIFDQTDKVKELILKSDRTIQTASLKLMEELGEFVSANFGLESYKHDTPEELQEEVVDVLQNAMSLYFLVQSKYSFDGAAILEKKNEKWAKCYVKK